MFLPHELNTSEGQQLAANVVGASYGDENGQPKGLISVESNLDLVFSWRQIKPLEGPVEVVDHPRLRLVHVHCHLIAGVFRLYLDPNGSGVAVAVCPIAIRSVTTVAVRAKTAITEIEIRLGGYQTLRMAIFVSPGNTYHIRGRMEPLAAD